MKALTYVGAAFAFVLAAVAAYVINGAVLQQLWEWFVIPEFPGTTPLSLPAAIGILIVASFLTAQYRYQNLDDEPKKKIVAGLLGYLFLYPPLVLFIGWIVHSFA